MKFSQRLHDGVRDIWQKTHEHPFVQGIGTGTLPIDSFARYMKQDYVFLIDYAKLFALGSLKSKDLEMMTAFAKLLHETLHVEMNLHREYAAQLGISLQQLEDTLPTPTNLAYTRYMLNVAHSGSLEELISALLPCMWSYWEIGKHLQKTHPDCVQHEQYGAWVSMYSSKEFGELAQWLIDVLDHLAEGKPERELEVLEKHFLTTSRFEYMFWDMVYDGNDWPV